MKAMLVPARAFLATARSATVLGACLSAQRSAARGAARRREDDGGSGSPARLRTDGASCSTCITATARGESARRAAAARVAAWALLRAASPRAGAHMRAGSQSAAQQVAQQRAAAEAARGRAWRGERVRAWHTQRELAPPARSGREQRASTSTQSSSSSLSSSSGARRIERAVAMAVSSSPERSHTDREGRLARRWQRRRPAHAPWRLNGRGRDAFVTAPRQRAAFGCRATSLAALAVALRSRFSPGALWAARFRSCARRRQLGARGRRRALSVRCAQPSTASRAAARSPGARGDASGCDAATLAPQLASAGACLLRRAAQRHYRVSAWRGFFRSR